MVKNHGLLSFWSVNTPETKHKQTIVWFVVFFRPNTTIRRESVLKMLYTHAHWTTINKTFSHVLSRSNIPSIMFIRHFELYLTIVVALALAAFLKYPPPPMSSELLSWNNTGHYRGYKSHSIFYRGIQYNRCIFSLRVHEINLQ